MIRLVSGSNLELPKNCVIGMEGVFVRLWSPAVWTHAAGDPDGFGTGGQSVSRPLMRRLAFKLSSRVAAPFQFFNPTFVGCEKDPAQSAGEYPGRGGRPRPGRLRILETICEPAAQPYVAQHSSQVQFCRGP